MEDFRLLNSKDLCFDFQLIKPNLLDLLDPSNLDCVQVLIMYKSIANKDSFHRKKAESIMYVVLIQVTTLTRYPPWQYRFMYALEPHRKHREQQEVEQPTIRALVRALWTRTLENPV